MGRVEIEFDENYVVLPENIPTGEYYLFGPWKGPFMLGNLVGISDDDKFIVKGVGAEYHFPINKYLCLKVLWEPEEEW